MTMRMSKARSIGRPPASYLCPHRGGSLRANANELRFPVADAQKADAAASLLIEGVKSLTAKKQFSAALGESGNM